MAGMRWQTEKPKGLAGARALSCVTYVPAFGLASVRVMDHAIDGTARPMGIGGSTG